MFEIEFFPNKNPELNCLKKVEGKTSKSSPKKKMTATELEDLFLPRNLEATNPLMP